MLSILAQAEQHFELRAWTPSMVELVRGAITTALILLAGLLFYVSLRKYIQRARLTAASLVAILASAIYFGVRAAKPDLYDEATLWLGRVFGAAMVFAAMRAFDRLVIIPILSRGGKVPVPRFLHEIISIVIFIFAILGYGAHAFGWDIDKFLAGSAVVSIVLGLALQETLGNFFSGLVMQASSPFAIGDWIVCAGVEGRVKDMTWRAVTILTLEDNCVIIPNGTIAKELIVNYNAPSSATARIIQVGLEYDLPPAEAISVLKSAAMESRGVSGVPEPHVFLSQFADSSIVYNVKFWINNPAEHISVEHEVRNCIWYRLKQKGFSIPFPIRTVEHIPLEKKRRQQTESSVQERHRAIADSWLLAPLTEEEKLAMAQSAEDVFLAAGQTVFRQDDAGETFFIIRKGNVDVLVRRGAAGETKVATLNPGDFFGEMSALTGQPRSATVRAASDLACVEICKSDLKRVFDSDPDMMGKLCSVITARTTERESAAQKAAESESRGETIAEKQKSLMGRMLAYFSQGSSSN